MLWSKNQLYREKRKGDRCPQGLGPSLFSFIP